MEQQKYLVRAYKIWWEGKSDIYVGCTKGKLAARMTNHRLDCRRGRQSIIYKTMRENGINNFSYVLLGSKEVLDRDEQRQYEQKWIDELKPTLNMQVAFATEDSIKKRINISSSKYREKNRKKIRENDKIYKKVYKAKIGKKYGEMMRESYKKNKVQCHCGGNYNSNIKYHRETHFNTKIHKKFKESINTEFRTLNLYSEFKVPFNSK